jgi:hypothetical protein
MVVSLTVCVVGAETAAIDDEDVAVVAEVRVDVDADDEQAATSEASAIPPTAAIFAGRLIR